MTNGTLLISGAALLILSIVLHVLLRSSTSSSSSFSSPLDHCNIAPTIQTMHWSPDAFVKAANTKRPIIFRKVPPIWLASNWTWKQLIQEAGDLNIDIETSNTPHLFYYDHGMTNLLDKHSWSTKIYNAMESATKRKSKLYKFSTFIKNMHQPSQPSQPTARNTKTKEIAKEESQYYYLTRTIYSAKNDDDDDLKQQKQTIDDTIFQTFFQTKYFSKPYSTSLTNNTQDTTLTLWIGGPNGTTTQSHYDQPHNMFVQLLGAKTFTILPPCAIDALYLYPDLHQRARKIKVPIDHISKMEQKSIMKFPLFHKYIGSVQKLTQVVVQPGDVLYLPPYWIHRVRVNNIDATGNQNNVGVAASANLFIKSHVSVLKKKLFNLPLPFTNQDIKSSTASIVVHKWLTAITKALNIDVQQLTDRLLHSRYQYIELKNQYQYQYTEGNTVNQKGKQCVRKMDDVLHVPIEFSSDTMTLHVSKFVAIASQIDTAVLWQMMQSYIEQVVYSMMGIHELRSFIKGCFL